MKFASAGTITPQPEPAYGGWREPVSRVDAWRDGLAAGFRVDRLGAREEQARSDLWARHQQVEQQTGQKLQPSRAMTGAYEVFNSATGEWSDLTDPDGMRAYDLRDQGATLTELSRGLSDDQYEAKIDSLRAAQPQAMANVRTRQEQAKLTSDKLNALAAKAQIGSEDHPVVSFIGRAAGGTADPVNVLATVYGGGIGAGRGLATRMLLQGGFNAGAEALATPLRMAEAKKYGGPEITAKDAALNIAGAGIVPAGFELAHAGLGAAGRAALSSLPEMRRAAQVAATAARDDHALAGVDGYTHQGVVDSLDRLEPVRVDPDRDLDALLASGPPANPTYLPPAREGLELSGAVDYRGRTLYAASFDPRQVTPDPVRFQYKSNGDAQGVTARLRGVEAWDPTAAGQVIVWQDRDGSLFIADGHQRFGLARRMEDKGWDARLQGFLLRERDGWSALEARTLAALKNLKEGSGEILDAAKVFRDAPEALRDRSLPVTGDFISQARGLALLSDEAFGAAVNKVIKPGYAADIGLMAGGRPDLHMNIVKLIKEAEPANGDEARALIHEALTDDWIKQEGDQLDLLGYDPSVSAMIGRAKVAASVKKTLARDAGLFNTLIRHADAIELGGNALARDANEARLAVDRAAMAVTSRLALRSGPLGEAMAEAAARVMKGEPPAKAAQQVTKLVRDMIAAGEEADLWRGQTLAPEPPTAAARDLAETFSEPGGAGAKAQAEPKPEEAAFERDPTPGLFDDLPEVGAYEKAHKALLACAPGGA